MCISVALAHPYSSHRLILTDHLPHQANKLQLTNFPYRHLHTWSLPHSLRQGRHQKPQDNCLLKINSAAGKTRSLSADVITQPVGLIRIYFRITTDCFDMVVKPYICKAVSSPHCVPITWTFRECRSNTVKSYHI